LAIPVERRPGPQAPPGAVLTDEEYERLARFRYVLRRFLRFSERAARAVGLTPQQHQLLLAIRGFPGRRWATVGELAERLQLRHNSTVGIIDRCERAGLAERKRDPRSRRRVRVHLTPRGEEVLARLSHLHRGELARIRGEIVRTLEDL
jgi:DNA-binding MarR family transcriptional regulator